MLSNSDQWTQMDKVPAIQYKVGEERILIVVTPRGREEFETTCPECGARVMKVRRRQAVDGRWLYYHRGKEGDIHCLGERGRARSRRRRKARKTK